MTTTSGRWEVPPRAVPLYIHRVTGGQGPAAAAGGPGEDQVASTYSGCARHRRRETLTVGESAVGALDDEPLVLAPDVPRRAPGETSHSFAHRRHFVNSSGRLRGVYRIRMTSSSQQCPGRACRTAEDDGCGTRARFDETRLEQGAGTSLLERATLPIWWSIDDEVVTAEQPGSGPRSGEQSSSPGELGDVFGELAHHLRRQCRAQGGDGVEVVLSGSPATLPFVDAALEHLL